MEPAHSYFYKPLISTEAALKLFVLNCCATHMTHVGLTPALRLTQIASGPLSDETRQVSIICCAIVSPMVSVRYILYASEVESFSQKGYIYPDAAILLL